MASRPMATSASPFYVGRRGKPVRKLRTMPMVRAQELAKKLQGRFGTTVSVV